MPHFLHGFLLAACYRDEGIFKMSYYTGLDSESMYVDSISASEAKLVSITKKDISMHYPIDKLPQYLKRFDTFACRSEHRDGPKCLLELSLRIL